MTRLRVLLVGPLPPPFGGMARFVQDLAGSETARRHHIEVFNTSFSPRVRSAGINTGHRRYEAGASSVGRRYGYLLGGGGLQAIRTLFAGLLSLPEFGVRLASFSPDIVHVFANMHWGFWRAGALVLLARVARRRVVFHPLGAIEKFYPSCGRAERFWIRWLLNRADLVLVQSPGLARLVAAMTRRPVQGIFNGIDLEPFRATRPDAPSNEVRFLSIGDLGHNKGTWDILEAAGRLRDDVPGALWIFIGRGDHEDALRRARAARVEERVRFLGVATEAEKLVALSHADVFLLPSHAEGQPLSILEAMAAGLPIVSTPVGSIAEVVGPEHGLLVPPGDVDALADAMRRLALDPALRSRLGATARKAALERFDVRRLHAELEERWLSLAAVPA